MATVPRVASPPGHLQMAWRLLDYWLTVYRRSWRGTVITSFVSPLLYVVAMGVLLGGFIKSDPSRLDGAPTYLAFVVPGLLATQVMQVVFGELTYPVMGMLKWHRIYHSMIATPLGVAPIVTSQLAFTVFRVATTSLVFLLVMLPFGVLHSVTAVPIAFGIQLLAGWAFATPIFAYSCFIKDESGFSIVFRLLMIPLSLFSGAFFPLSNLPVAVQPLAKLLPLWHATDLTRMATTGHWHAGPAVIHLVYLLVLGAIGWVLTIRFLSRKLVR